MISPPIESRDAQPFRPQLNQPQVAHFLHGAVDMDWRQTGAVGKVQLRQWHRALAAIAKVNSLPPIKDFTEQLAQLFNCALSAQIDEPFVLNIGITERFGPNNHLHSWCVTN